MGKDSSDQNLERRRGGKSAALHYVGGGVRAEAADLHSFLLEACCNAAYQRSGGVLLLGHDRKLGKIHAVLGEALGLNHDLVVLGRFNYGDDIKVYAGCEYLAVVVVGVVSAYLGSSRRGEESVLADGAEMLRECGHCVLVALLLCLRLGAGVNVLDGRDYRFHLILPFVIRLFFRTAFAASYVILFLRRTCASFSPGATRRT